MRISLALAPALMLAACGGGDRGTADDGGTQISIKGGDAGNGFSAGMGKDGKVSIDAPGFKANIDLPSIKLDAGDFDINGVSLPDGSKIRSMDIAGNNGGDGVKVAFTSPVGTAAVRDWFQGKLQAEGFTLKADGDNLTGTTDEGKAFSLTTRASGAGASESVLTVGK